MTVKALQNPQPEALLWSDECKQQREKTCPLQKADPAHWSLLVVS